MLLFYNLCNVIAEKKFYRYNTNCNIINYNKLLIMVYVNYKMYLESMLRIVFRTCNENDLLLNSNLTHQLPTDDDLIIDLIPTFETY